MTSCASIEDQKKRTLEALERRFKQAEESETRTQQRKNNNRPYVSKDSPSKKENESSSSYNAPKDTEANNPVYFKLSHSVNENLLKAGVEISNNKKESTVRQVLDEFLQHGDVASKFVQRSRSMKIDKCILLDNFVQKGGGVSEAAHLRAIKTHAKRSKKHMSLTQHKKIGTFDLPKEFHKFELFKPMQEKWKSYISQLVKNVGENELAKRILNADLHGAFIIVVECKVDSLNGVNGLMIRETAETFGIITQDNKFRVVAKKLSVFMLQVDCWKITLHGDKLTSRTIMS